MRPLVIFFLILCSLYAQTVNTRYSVDMSVLGSVGYADVDFMKNGDEYEIRLVATATGVAATLLSQRVETFISKGRIIKGKYTPDVFIKIKETTKKRKEERYYFDHDRKEILLKEESKKFYTKLLSSKIRTKVSTNEKKLDIYRRDDVLSIYLNTTTNCLNAQGSFKLTAIGSHDDENDITVSRLDKNAKEAASKYFSCDECAIYNLNVTPTKDKDDDIVDVLVAFDNEGLLNEAYLGEVFWVGRAVAKRVYHKISSN